MGITEEIEEAEVNVVEYENLGEETKEDEEENKLQELLEKICQKEQVIGYIIKDSERAFVNLKDVESIHEFALLSSEIFESHKKLDEQFEIGNLKNAVVECRDLKMFCTQMADSQISLFAEKEFDETKVIKDLSKMEKTLT